uniref:Uncharacterized protein n=1 Tax=viral metagenome TaxID=1070528 RepID=A0A6C0JUN9_9ZZZZ
MIWKILTIASVATLVNSLFGLATFFLIREINDFGKEKTDWIMDTSFSCTYKKYILTSNEPPWYVDIYGNLLENVTLTLETSLNKGNLTTIINSTVCPTSKSLEWYRSWSCNDRTDSNIYNELAIKYPINIPTNCTINRDCTKFREPISTHDLYFTTVVYMSLEYGIIALMIFICIFSTICSINIYKRRKQEEYLVVTFDGGSYA